MNKTVWVQLYNLSTDEGIQFKASALQIWQSHYRVRIDRKWYYLKNVTGWLFDCQEYTDLAVEATAYKQWRTISTEHVKQALPCVS